MKDERLAWYYENEKFFDSSISDEVLAALEI